MIFEFFLDQVTSLELTNLDQSAIFAENISKASTPFT